MLVFIFENNKIIKELYPIWLNAIHNRHILYSNLLVFLTNTLLKTKKIVIKPQITIMPLQRSIAHLHPVSPLSLSLKEIGTIFLQLESTDSSHWNRQ